MDMRELTNDQIAYLLHRYYPEHKDVLTTLDWDVYLVLTNCLCGCKSFPLHGSTQEKKLQEIVDTIFTADSV